MLKTMRGMAAGFGAKILLALLIVSFAVWGVGDMLRSRVGGGTLATVDGQPISHEAFQRKYAQALERARQVLGKQYSPQLVRMLGVERQVLEQMIMGELLRRETDSLGLLVPDAVIAREIRTDPNFADAKGQFDRAAFDAVLRRNNLSEAAYVAGIKQEKAVSLLLTAITLRAPINDAMLAALWEAQNEERSAELIVLMPGHGKTAAPAEDALKTFYQAHAEMFAAPEYRTVRYAAIHEDALLAEVKVPEEEVKAAYDERAALFKGSKTEPYEKVRPALEKELRAEHAEEAVAKFSAKLEDMLAGGSTLQEAAAALHMNSAAVGPVAHTGATPHGALAKDIPPYEGFLDTAFGVEENGESPLRKGAAGVYYMVKVEKVTPTQAKPFAEVKEEVAAAWRRQEEARQLQAEAHALADALRPSKNPAEEAAKRGVSTVASGRLKRNSVKAGDLMLPPPLVQEIFALEPGKATGAYATRDGRYMLAIVKARFPSARAAKENIEAERAKQDEMTRQELREAYIQYLRGKYHVTVNNEALSALSADAGEQ